MKENEKETVNCFESITEICENIFEEIDDIFTIAKVGKSNIDKTPLLTKKEESMKKKIDEDTCKENMFIISKQIENTERYLNHLKNEWEYWYSQRVESRKRKEEENKVNEIIET